MAHRLSLSDRVQHTTRRHIHHDRAGDVTKKDSEHYICFFSCSCFCLFVCLFAVLVVGVVVVVVVVAVVVVIVLLLLLLLLLSNRRDTHSAWHADCL